MSITNFELFSLIFSDLQPHKNIGYKPILYKKDNQYYFQIRKNLWGDIWTPIDNRDDKTVINWTRGQLKDQYSCKRTTFNTWIFDSKQEAEKFMTFFTLKWSS